MKRTLLIAALVTFLISSAALSEEKIFRIGMIGLDTSHVTAFTGEINNNVDKYHCKVVAAFKGGSPDVESSASRVDNFTKQLQDKYGVEIVDTIEELCTKVDGVMLESVDGRPHLKQAKPVIAAGLPLFIDKPMAGNLADVLEIFRLAKEAKVPCWSSSSLRYTPGVYTARTDPNLGGVVGCDAYGPCSLEPHHPDLYWYGVHTAEMLFTVMGTGCKSVCRTQTDGFEFVVGKWNDGRIGTFRGMRQGKSGDYGVTIFGKKEIIKIGKHPNYKPLIEDVIKFFKTKEVPVPAEETIELFAFMSAADESKAKGGVPISIKEVIEQAELTNAKRQK
jgi:hypothetical protein